MLKLMSPPLNLLGISLSAALKVEPSGASPTTWIGGALCLILWIGYGWTLRKSGEKMRIKLMRMSRKSKVFFGSGGMILGLAFLVGGMALLAALGGADAAGIKWWAWPIILVIGGAFIHAQVLGAAALTTLMLDQREPKQIKSASGQKEAPSSALETARETSASEPTESEPTEPTP